MMPMPVTRQSSKTQILALVSPCPDFGCGVPKAGRGRATSMPWYVCAVEPLCSRFMLAPSESLSSHADLSDGHGDVSMTLR